MRASLATFLWFIMAFAAVTHKMKLDAGVAECAAEVEFSKSTRFWDNRKFEVEMARLKARQAEVAAAKP